MYLCSVVLLCPKNPATVIAMSTMESELIALDTTCAEVEWLKKFFIRILYRA